MEEVGQGMRQSYGFWRVGWGWPHRSKPAPCSGRQRCPFLKELSLTSFPRRRESLEAAISAPAAWWGKPSTYCRPREGGDLLNRETIPRE